MQPLPQYDLGTPDSQPGFRIEALVRTGKYNPNHPHRHSYHEVFLFTAGEGKHMIDFQEYPIAAGNVHFVFPGQVHQVMRSADSEGVVICFSPTLLKEQEDWDLLHAFREQPLLEAGAEKMAGLMRWIHLYQTESPPAKGSERHLLGIVLRKSMQVREASATQLGPGDALMPRFLMLLESDFRLQKQVGQYAEALHVTQDKLNESCRASMGKTAGACIRARILLEAKRLLLHSELSVKEIAFALGYEDPAYFNRIFQKEEQAPPQRFRELIRKKYNSKGESSIS